MFAINIFIQVSSWLAFHSQTVSFALNIIDLMWKMRLLCHLKHPFALIERGNLEAFQWWLTNFLPIFWESALIGPHLQKLQFFYSGDFNWTQFHRPQVWLIPQCPNDQKLSNTIKTGQYTTTQDFGRLATKKFGNHCSFPTKNYWQTYNFSIIVHTMITYVLI